MGTDEQEAPFASPLELLTGVVVCFVLAMALGVTALLLPTHAIQTKTSPYTQAGSFEYQAHVPKSSVYGPNGLTTGDPIIVGTVHEAEFRFTYKLRSPANTDNVHGNHTMTARVDLGSGLTREIPVSSRQNFHGDTFTMRGTFDTSDLTRMWKLAQTAGINSSGGLTVTLLPQVQTVGTIEGQQLKTTFHPTLTFDFNGNVLTLRRDAPAGADTGSDSPEEPDPLAPSDSGKVSYKEVTSNTLPLILVHPTVLQGRIAGFGAALVLLGLALWLARPLLGRGPMNETPKRIGMLYGSRLVQVNAMSTVDGPIADVASISALAELAKRYEAVIMHLNDGHDTYAVWDNGLMYRYRPSKRYDPADRTIHHNELGADPLLHGISQTRPHHAENRTK